MNAEHEGLDRRSLIRKGLVGAGVAVAAPVVLSQSRPAGAAGSGNEQSLSFTISGASVTKDATSAALPASGTGCTLAGYQSGQASTLGASGTAAGQNGSTPETATITVTGMPSDIACTITGIAKCNGGACDTASVTKPIGQTSATISFSIDCGGNTRFASAFLYVA